MLVTQIELENKIQAGVITNVGFESYILLFGNLYTRTTIYELGWVVSNKL